MKKRVIHEVFKSIGNYFNIKKITLREGIRRVLLYACVVAFVVSGYTVVEKWYTDYVTEKKYKNMKIPDNTSTSTDDDIFGPAIERSEAFELPNPEDKTTSSYLDYTKSESSGNSLTGSGRVIGTEYFSFLEINKDVVGYISIPDTAVEYPVLQDRLSNDYYLEKTIDLKKKTAASIFMDYRNRPYSEDQNTILYGHNMNNGSMFGELHKYDPRGKYNRGEKAKEFAMGHTYIYYSTLYEDMVWEIFSTYTTDIEFDYIQTSFRTDDEYSEFLAACKKKSDFKYNAAPGIHDRILTLSTCTSKETNRFVVQAMLVSRTKK